MLHEKSNVEITHTLERNKVETSLLIPMEKMNEQMLLAMTEMLCKDELIIFCF